MKRAIEIRFVLSAILEKAKKNMKQKLFYLVIKKI